MDGLMMMLLAIVFLSLLAGLVFTLRIRSRQKSEIDSGVSNRVKDNPVWLNPVIWSYVLFVALIFMVIWMFKLFYKVPF